MKAVSLHVVATLLLLSASASMAQQPAPVVIANRGPERDRKKHLCLTVTVSLP